MAFRRSYGYRRTSRRRRSRSYRGRSINRSRRSPMMGYQIGYSRRVRARRSRYYNVSRGGIRL